MTSPNVYFDTSVFIGLLDNRNGRQPTAREIVRYESGCQSKVHTSIMTVNEFISRAYDEYHDKPNLKDKVEEVIQSIRDVAEIQAFNQEVAKEAARLLSAWGRHNVMSEEPRQKKFRWDAIHLATANLLGVDRAYAWDGPWNSFPKSEIPALSKSSVPPSLPNQRLISVNLLRFLDSLFLTFCGCFWSLIVDDLP